MSSSENPSQDKNPLSFLDMEKLSERFRGYPLAEKEFKKMCKQIIQQSKSEEQEKNSKKEETTSSTQCTSGGSEIYDNFHSNIPDDRTQILRISSEEMFKTALTFLLDTNKPDLMIHGKNILEKMAVSFQHPPSIMFLGKLIRKSFFPVQFS